MKKKWWVIGLCVLLVGGLLALRYVPMNADYPSQDRFNLEVNEIPSEMKVGEEIQVEAVLRNTLLHSYRVLGGQELIQIDFYPADQGGVAHPSIGVFHPVYAGVPETCNRVIRAEKSGEYILKIHADISVEAKGIFAGRSEGFRSCHIQPEEIRIRVSE